jgi:hypothetical protein
MRIQFIISADERQHVALIPSATAGVLYTPNFTEFIARPATPWIAILKGGAVGDRDICNEYVVVTGIAKRGGRCCSDWRP